MSQIIVGSITLSLIHALIPSHWLPMVAIAKAQGWDNARLLRTTALAGLAHTVSTTLIGLMVSFAGVHFAENEWFITGRIVPAILFAWGIWFLVQHYRHHTHSHIRQEQLREKSYPQLLISLVVMMFLSPCLEINAFFLSAGAQGPEAVMTIAIIYNVVTIGGMLLMTTLAFKGLSHFNAGWARNEQLITGLTLVCLALLNFFAGL